jgi:4-oxalocrotonate tautomerase
LVPDRVDDAYRAKYKGSPYLSLMIAPRVRTATVKVTRVTPMGDQKAQKSRRKDRTIRHVIVKLWPGKTGQQKTRLAEQIAKDIIDILQYGEESVFVATEEPRDWADKVYKTRDPVVPF